MAHLFPLPLMPAILFLLTGCAGPQRLTAAPDADVVRPFFFIQMSDPQFGMMEGTKLGKARTYQQEINNYRFAIAEANRLKPDFVVVTGDLIQDPGDEDQLAILKRLNGRFDRSIPLHLVAGNHDVGNEPTAESLAAYRKTVGPDHYAFHHRGCHFIVLNSCICQQPTHVPDEWEKHLAFLKAKLAESTERKVNHTILFMHHPLFLKQPDEADQYFVIPKARRTVMLELLKAHKVSAVFAGHWHRNSLGRDGVMEMVTTGPVGMPLGDDPSGFRIVKVYPDRIEHAYHVLGRMPLEVKLEAAASGSGGG